MFVNQALSIRSPGFQPDDEPLTVPDLNIVAVYRAFGLGFGLAVVATDQRLKADKMAVVTNDISPILLFWREPSSP